jgi:hypothetical protein
MAPDEYEAAGCAMRALYECTKKRHHRAEGASYESCRRVSEYPLSDAPADALDPGAPARQTEIRPEAEAPTRP